jgi:hypothetical protein
MGPPTLLACSLQLYFVLSLAFAHYILWFLGFSQYFRALVLFMSKDRLKKPPPTDGLEV